MTGRKALLQDRGSLEAVPGSYNVHGRKHVRGQELQTTAPRLAWSDQA